MVEFFQAEPVAIACLRRLVKPGLWAERGNLWRNNSRAFEQFDIFHQPADFARLRIGVCIEKYEHIAFSGGSGQMFGGRNAQPLFMPHDLDLWIAAFGCVDRAVGRAIVGDNDFVIERAGGGLSQMRGFCNSLSMHAPDGLPKRIPFVVRSNQYAGSHRTAL